MTNRVTEQTGLKKSQPQYHSITRMTGHPKIRMFTCAMGQWLRKYHGFDIDFSYQWVRHEDGSLYFALTGSRSVQDVFAAYVDNNQGDYYDTANVVQYGRNTPAFRRAFNKLLESRQLRHGYGESKR